MECYKLIDGVLKQVADPVEVGAAKHIAGADEAIAATGYRISVCSSRTAAEGAEISIYETEDRSLPRYYIELMGPSQSIASFVADNFPALLATLKEIAPLTALIGLDQAASLHAYDNV
jgi:hypothetical protein